MNIFILYESSNLKCSSFTAFSLTRRVSFIASSSILLNFNSIMLIMSLIGFIIVSILPLIFWWSTNLNHLSAYMNSPSFIIMQYHNDVIQYASWLKQFCNIYILIHFYGTSSIFGEKFKQQRHSSGISISATVNTTTTVTLWI